MTVKNIKKNLWIYGLVLLIVILVINKVITGKMIMVCFLALLGLMTILFLIKFYRNTLSQVDIAKKDSMIKNDQIESYKKKVQMANDAFNTITINYDNLKESSAEEISDLQNKLNQVLDAYKELKRTQYMEDYVPMEDNIFGDDIPSYKKLGIMRAITEANITEINERYPDPERGSYFLIQSDLLKVIVYNGIGWIVMKRTNSMK